MPIGAMKPCSRMIRTLWIPSPPLGMTVRGMVPLIIVAMDEYVLVRQAERGREELHVGGGLAAHVGEVVEEPRRDGVALVELDGSDVVLALEVFDVRVVRVEALGRTLERLAADGELAQELGVLGECAPTCRGSRRWRFVSWRETGSRGARCRRPRRPRRGLGAGRIRARGPIFPPRGGTVPPPASCRDSCPWRTARPGRCGTWSRRWPARRRRSAC